MTSTNLSAEKASLECSIMMRTALSYSFVSVYRKVASFHCRLASHARSTLLTLTRLQKYLRCSMSLSARYLEYSTDSSVKMPWCALSRPSPCSSSLITSSKWPRRSYSVISSSRWSGFTMMFRPQICARRNSPASTHAAFTIFHVRVDDALRAASTASRKAPSRTWHAASLALELMLLNSTRAASNLPSANRRSPTGSICATWLPVMKISRSPRRSVCASAYTSSVSTKRSLSFLRAICRKRTRSSYLPAACAAAVTSLYAAASLALMKESMAAFTSPAVSCARASRLHTSGSSTRLANSSARARSPMWSMSTPAASTWLSNFL
mmetsp:Transcript_20370/g.72037  ORF Transcript_20370/g.72037 Transcript_20370/m.72037 type:complete len:324 (-) Transcript_20370:3465-4436(-)